MILSGFELLNLQVAHNCSVATA